MHADGLVSDVEEGVLVEGKGGTLSLELEDNDSIVVGWGTRDEGELDHFRDLLSTSRVERTGSEEVEVGMSDESPEPVVLPPERLDGRPLTHVPHSDGFVLGDGENELVARVEEGDTDVVEVTSAGVNLPGFGVAHPPKLDLTVVRARDDEREGRVERNPAAKKAIAPSALAADAEEDGSETRTHLTPRSCPSSTYLTTASVLPKRSACPEFARCICSSNDMGWWEVFFFRRPEMSQTRTVRSIEAETTRSSLGWN